MIKRADTVHYFEHDGIRNLLTLFDIVLRLQKVVLKNSQ